MTIYFHYKRIERPGILGSALTPSIPIILTGPCGSFETMGLIDSGADVSAIPHEIAEALGLDLSGPSSTAEGIGGKAETKDSYMTIEIKTDHERHNFQISVKVIMGQSNIGVLLGRDIFFDKFRILFDQPIKRIGLTPTGH